MPAIVIALSILGAFGVTAYLIAPGRADASLGRTREIQAAQVERNQAVINGIATLLASCAQIIAIHQRDDSGNVAPYVEVLLRTHEGEHDESPAVEELALISHSEILQTVTLYTLAETESGGVLRQAGLWGWPELADRAFADRWRSDPRIKGRIIATGVSDMQIDRLDQADRDSMRLWISLTWSPESVDGGDEASAVVEVRHPRSATR